MSLKDVSFHIANSDICSLGEKYISMSQIKTDLPVATFILIEAVNSGKMTKEEVSNVWLSEFLVCTNALEFMRVLNKLKSSYPQIIIGDHHDTSDIFSINSNFGGTISLDLNFKPSQLTSLSSEQAANLRGLISKINKKVIEKLSDGSLSEIPPKKDLISNRNHDFNLSIPVEHFLEVSIDNSKARQKELWKEVKDLDDNDTRKILYFRRFTNEFQHNCNPELTSKSEERRFSMWSLDDTLFDILPHVKPYETQFDIPEGFKICLSTGYHHLEKPYGRMLVEMIKDQVQFDLSKVLFYDVVNTIVPTGDVSIISENETALYCKTNNVTHLIDIHEMLSSGNIYMDYVSTDEYKPRFNNSKKNPGGKSVTLDPTVPLWCIEQFYRGKVYPLLQLIVNNEIRRIEKIIQTF